LKQHFGIVRIDGGRQIDSSDAQPSNADSPRFESLLPDSNVKSERCAHQAKQNFEMVSTDEGIQIDRIDEQRKNADSPKLKTWQFDSNLTDTIESL
jgi:hypothetical protein